jgi:hypothetical protein
MKRPSEYMVMNDGYSYRDYAKELEKYANFLESEVHKYEEKNKPHPPLIGVILDRGKLPK